MPQDISPSLGKLLDEFADFLLNTSGRSQHTVRAYVSDVERLFLVMAENDCREITDLSLSVLRIWLASEYETHSPATTAANAASTTNSRAIPTDGYNPKDALGRERLCSEEE